MAAEWTWEQDRQRAHSKYYKNGDEKRTDMYLDVRTEARFFNGVLLGILHIIAREDGTITARIGTHAIRSGNA